MRVLLSWLHEFAPIGDDVDALADEMSALGLAVEDVIRVGTAVDGVVVARVLDTRAHPDADKVHLVDVDTGNGEALQIVCGAFNMQAGDLVPLATLGTTMPNGMEIGRRKMRGEWSNGMLCSPRELGLGDDHAGILILDPALPVGEALVAGLPTISTCSESTPVALAPVQVTVLVELLSRLSTTVLPGRFGEPVTHTSIWLVAPPLLGAPVT